MAERIRVKCPCCGLSPFIEMVEQNAEEGDGHVLVLRQVWGGKMAVPPQAVYKKVGRGKAPGRFEVTDITDQSPDIVAHAKHLFDISIQRYQDAK